jgi:hypothetical protein
MYIGIGKAERDFGSAHFNPNDYQVKCLLLPDVHFLPPMPPLKKV